jgi:hypothetical protein
MKTLLLFTLSGFLAMQAPNPSAPFPNHEQPPEGWSCHPALHQKDLETDAHACACRGMTSHDPQPTPEQCEKTPTYDGEGTQNGEVLIEHSTCKVYCHKSHCTCAKRCGTT